jgi:hypothetical protein
LRKCIGFGGGKYDLDKGQVYTELFLKTLKRCSKMYKPEDLKIKLHFNNGNMIGNSHASLLDKEFKTYEDCYAYLCDIVNQLITSTVAVFPAHKAVSVASLIKKEFKRVWQYVDQCDIESDYKHSCAASDMIYCGLRDTPYTCGYRKLAGRTSVEDKERASIFIGE